jgi:mRNA interferase MazF
VKPNPRYVPDRGDAIWIALDPQAGHEQAGRRPALVLSPASYNGRVGLALVCPITSHVKGYPFEVILPPGLRIAGAVLADHVKNLDWRVRKARLMCAVPEVIVNQVVTALNVLIAKAN